MHSSSWSPVGTKGAAVRGQVQALLASVVVSVLRRSGYLRQAMRFLAFRKAIGRDGRWKAWVALGAQISPTASIGPRVNMRFPEHVSIGDGSKLGGRVFIDSWGDVTIGRNVILGGDIDLLSTQHDVDHPGLKGEKRTVTIGDYAWLPVKIIVLPGVHIGHHAVIGTGSVVSRDVPDYGVAVGNPAVVVKERARIEYTYVPTGAMRARQSK